MRVGMQLLVIGVLAAGLAAGWLALSGWSDASAPKAETGRQTATRVLVEPVRFAADRVVVRLIGTGEALKSASIYPSVDGEVVEVGFRAEQRVTEGMVLLRLDDKHERLAVELAEVALAEAERQVRRLRKLAPSGAVARARLETTEAERDSARVRLDQARAELDDRTVLAPFDGVIGLSDIEKGDRVDNETMIATLDDRSAILVDFNLPEDYADRARAGDRVAVQTWTTPPQQVDGVIEATDSRIDPVTRTLRVRVRIANPDDRIRPGTSFQVQLAFTGGTFASVREVAVLWSRDGAYVWRAVDGQAEKVFVTVVRRDRGRVLVDGPLEEGDAIVVEGFQGLREGQRVNPADFTAGTAPWLRPGRTPWPA